MGDRGRNGRRKERKIGERGRERGKKISYKYMCRCVHHYNMAILHVHASESDVSQALLVGFLDLHLNACTLSVKVHVAMCSCSHYWLAPLV